MTEMTNNSEITEQEPITAQQLAEIIIELEEYRERLLNETLNTAKRAKLPESKARAQLEPHLAQIDAKLQELREQQLILSHTN